MNLAVLDVYGLTDNVVGLKGLERWSLLLPLEIYLVR